MSDGKTPKVGEAVLWQDDEEEYRQSNITEVSEINDETGLFPVETEDGPFTVYLSEEDENWAHFEE